MGGIGDRGGVAPPPLSNAGLPASINAQEIVEVQMLRNESKSCIRTPGQRWVTADSPRLDHYAAGDFQAQTSTGL